MAASRILVYDIETMANLGYVWGKYEQDVIRYAQEWFMLCFAYKWLGEKKTHVIAQSDFVGYKAGSNNDRQVIKALHKLFDEADIVIAHNGDQFDQKKSHARFIFHGMTPPSPYQQIDTKKMAKRYFSFNSNKLDDLGEHLGLGRKVDTGGFDLWMGCYQGNQRAWRKMKEYNKQDVILLEKVYLKLLPWDTGHPNRANIEGRPEACPRCGKEGFLFAQGIRYTKTGQYRRWQCKACGSYISDRKADKHEKPTYV